METLLGAQEEGLLLCLPDESGPSRIWLLHGFPLEGDRGRGILQALPVGSCGLVFHDTVPFSLLPSRPLEVPAVWN